MTQKEGRPLVLAAFLLAACNVTGWRPDQSRDGASAVPTQDALARPVIDGATPLLDGRANPGPDAAKPDTSAPDAPTPVTPAPDTSTPDTPAPDTPAVLDAAVAGGLGPDAPAASPNGDTGGCSVLPGQYADGVHAGASGAFAAAYARHAPWIGCAAGNGGFGSYAHNQAGVDLQDFYQPDEAARISASGWTALVYNSLLNAAFLLQGEMWHAYACLSQGDNIQANLGGAWLVGAPTSEPYADGGRVRQDFAQGWMVLEAPGSTVTFHFIGPRRLPSGLESLCESQGLHIELVEMGSVDAGRLDAPTDGPEKQPACAQPVDITAVKTTHGGSAKPPSCTIDSDGAVVLDYADTQCPVGMDTPFRGCEFAWHQNLKPFDPPQGHGGVFEIFFCVSGPVTGAVNVWYQQGTCKECRYSLPLLSGGESLVGCRKVYVAPEDVGRNVPWRPGPFCQARNYDTGMCVAPVDGGDGDAADARRVPEPDAYLAEAGAIDGARPARPMFDDSMLVLMQEWCDTTKAPVVPSQPARITLKSIVYHPAQCLCSGDQDCSGGYHCQRVGWPDEACCACRDCPGICR